MDKINNKKELVISYCKECLKSDEESEKIYRDFLTDEKLLDEFCYYISNKEFPSAGVIIREYTYSTLQFYKEKFLNLKNPLEAYLFMLKLRKNPKEEWAKYIEKHDAYNKELNKKNAKFDRNILKIMHNIATSGILDKPYSVGYYTRDYACENFCCPSEEYLSSDWDAILRVDEDFEKYVKNRKNIIFSNGYHIAGYVDGKLVNISIKVVE